MKKIIFSIAVFSVLSACHKQEYYQVNPNAPTVTTPALLLTGICYDLFRVDITGAAFASRHLTYYERPNSDVNYGWNESEGYSDYATLRQVNQMEKLALSNNDKNYQALAKLFRAILFSRLSERFGDIPYREALKGEEGIDNPAYDTQEAVFAGLLQELDQANDLLTNATGTIGGDIIFAGNPKKWQQTVNAFTLRLLIHLSKKENNTTLNIKQRFSNIVNNAAKYPLMTSVDDNAQLKFNTSAPNNYYPTFNSNSVSSLVSMEKGFVKILKDRKDQRLFYFADPIVGKAANNFDNYEGVDAGLIISDQQNAATSASKIHRRYVQNEINEPWIFIGFAEQELLIAEGITRGWASGSAQNRYNSGVRASMRSYGIGSIQMEQYLSNPLNTLVPAKAIEQIIIQKYIALFMHSGREPFLEQRRTGFPSFSTGPATLNGGVIPKRWKYPQSEYQYNKANLDAAIARQYPGGDNVNGEMWILK